MSLLFAVDRRPAHLFHGTSAFCNNPSGFRRLKSGTAVTPPRDVQIRGKRLVCGTVAMPRRECRPRGAKSAHLVAVLMVCACAWCVAVNIFSVDHKQNCSTLKRAAWCFTLYVTAIRRRRAHESPIHLFQHAHFPAIKDFSRMCRTLRVEHDAAAPRRLRRKNTDGKFDQRVV
jgi:hypothetical protein